MDFLATGQEYSGAFKIYLSRRVDYIVALSLVAALLHLWVAWPRKASIPILSHHKGWSAPWKDAVRYLKDSPGVLKEGYEKYSKNGQFFQLSTPTRWFIVAPPKYIDEIREAPEDYLSPRIAANDVVQTKFTVSPIVEANKFHLVTIKTALTPNLGLKIDDIRDEIELAFADEIGVSEDWKPIAMSQKAHRIVTRAANRLLVGAPLCRNEEYLQMSIKYTIDVFGGADKLRAYPDFFKLPATYLVTNVRQQQSIARKHLLPYIQARLAEEKKYLQAGRVEDWKRDKPHDSLQWVIDAAPNEKERQPNRLVYRILHINVAAVHTTSVTYLNCMFDLATHPEIHEELRQEVEQVVREKGWTKQAVNDLRKIDSFMTESQRLSPIASSQMTRGVARDFTFSDGTTVPKGSFVLVPMYAMYTDNDLFPNAETFDAFRFSRLREQEGQENKHQFVTTSTSHINFGHGKHACPGRFFASNEIKLLLAHTLLNYDVKLAGAPPKPTWFDRSRRPDLKAQVLFRKRSSAV
ncbi:MAG: hypothetical protein M1825_003266 [Sarcosagium campestre]|nr:MAG: hypothetical protein M1825_003266 [Sarcosagium campestre]